MDTFKKVKILTKIHMKHDYFVYLSCVLYCFLLMLFCTKSSPLFSFNDWFDANAYFTMGKGFFNGYVPYVDLIDGKGPLLYFIYGISWMISHTTFFGVYLLQSLLLSICTIFIYKLARIYIDDRGLAFLVAIISQISMIEKSVYAAGFDYGGGGPDEFCRSFLIIALFYFSLYHEKPQLYKYRHTVLQGFLFSCVLFIKFNLAVFWFGFLLVIIFENVYQQKYKQLFRHILSFIVGFGFLAVPYLIYAMMTKSLTAFYDNYIMYNSIYSGTASSESLIKKAISSLSLSINSISGKWIFTLLLILGLVFVLIKCKKFFKIAYFTSLVVFLTSSFFALHFPYIYIPITSFHIYGIIAIITLIQFSLKTQKNILTELSIASCLIFILSISINNLITYKFFASNEKTTQQQVAEIISKESDNKTPTLLEIGELDSGFYTASGIIPNEPFFYIPNISYEAFPLPYEAQKKAVEECKSDFMIAWSPNPYNIRKNYNEVLTMQGTGYQTSFLYHLFKRRYTVYDDNLQDKIRHIESNTNNSFESLTALTDKDPLTFWDTRRGQTPGDYLIYEFQDNVDYNCFFIDLSERSYDYPRALSLFVSNDGIDWENVSLNQVDIFCYAEFDAKSYRFLKMVVNESAESWWSISDVYFGYTEQSKNAN